MKKGKVLGLMSLMLVFAAMSLGSGSSGETKEITASETVSSGSEAGASENSEEKSDNKVTIEEQLLFEQDNVKVTATEYVEDKIWGDGIKLLVENSGDKDIRVGCDALIVNDYMISDLFSTKVAAGKKDYETLNLSSSALKAAGIENVGKIEVYFRTSDADSYDTLSKIDCVEIKTSNYDSMDTTPNDSGQELYNEDGLKIVGKYVDENSFWGKGVLLYIENNSGKDMSVHCDDMSINGFMVTPYFSSTVYDGKKAISEITLMSSELEENNITSIEDVELKFRIMEKDNYSSSKETDIISFSAK